VNALGKVMGRKCAHRADPFVEIAEGNHRAVGPSVGEPADAPDWEILHVPERSWPQYARKIDQGTQALVLHPVYGAKTAIGEHWRSEYDALRAGRLEQEYFARRFDATHDWFEPDVRLRDRVRALASQAVVAGAIEASC
jgi:hypothetical protein